MAVEFQWLIVILFLAWVLKIEFAIAGLRGDVIKRMEAMQTYLHDTAHNQADYLHALGLKVERLIGLEEGKIKLKEKP